MTIRDTITMLEHAREEAALYLESQGYPFAAESLRREVTGLVGTLRTVVEMEEWRKTA